MSEYFIAPIVEGHGEVEALPILLHRIFQESGAVGVLRVNQPQRVKAQSFLQLGDEFARHVELAARKAKSFPRGFVLILLDCDDGCPAQIGPMLLAHAVVQRPDVPFLVTLAKSEFESWFLAAANSLGGTSGLPQNLRPPPEPESKRGAKEWLSERLKRRYNEPNDQPNFTRIFDLDEAATVPSFARLRAKLRHFFQSC